MKTFEGIKRQQGAGALGLAVAALLVIDAAVLAPAWQSRSEVKAEVVAAEHNLTQQREKTASIPQARDEYAQKRSALMELEADLVAANQDTSLIKQVQALAGSWVTVRSYQAGEPEPVGAGEGSDKKAKDENVQAPYSRVPYELEASGSWTALTAFLRTLETKVTGLRVEGVELAYDPDAGTVLRVVGSLYRVDEPMPESPGQAAALRN